LDRFAVNGNYVVTAISLLATFSQSAEITTPNDTLFGRVLFSKQQSVEIAAPNSTPLGRVLFSKQQPAEITAPNSTPLWAGTV
jgi:hypothetical protein